MVTFRVFRNNDPPKLQDLWNRSRGGRGFGLLVRYDQLEQVAFCKPYFDRNGFIIAEDEGKIVGFCHVGQGCDPDQTRLDATTGTIAMMMVHPDYRRRGIGSDLLFKAQEHLKSVGVKQQYAGAMYPLNPYYLGLYGGSEMPGILESDADATRFVMRRGYMPVAHVNVLTRNLDTVPDIKDTRLILLRRKVEISVESWPSPTSWWQACTMNHQPALRYELVDKDTRQFIAKAWVWDMEAFTKASGTPTVGLTELFVVEEFRRKGYAKLVMLTVLKHLREQSIGMIETQVMAANAPAMALMQSVGFERVDTGHIYKLIAPRFPAPSF